jgi:hypothetical protein
VKRFSTSALLWMSISKVALGITIVVGLAHVQAAPNDAAPNPSGSTAQSDAAKPAAKAPKAHRHQKEVTLAPVKPETYPSHPLPPVPTPSKKP